MDFIVKTGHSDVNIVFNYIAMGFKPIAIGNDEYLPQLAYF